MKKILELLSAIERWLRIYCIQNKTVYNSKQAAIYLDVSLQMIHTLTRQRLIPHYKPSGKIMYFKREDMDKWALRNPVQTRLEIEAQPLAPKKEKRSKK